MKIAAIILAAMTLGAGGAYAGTRGFGYFSQVDQTDYQLTTPDYATRGGQLVQVITVPNYGVCAVFNLNTQHVVCK